MLWWAAFLKICDPTSASFKLFFCSFFASLGLYRTEEKWGFALD
jgi:hypothetical protein